MFTTGESFLDGPAMQAAKGPLIGGGLTQLGAILVRKFMPTMAKHATLIGTMLGSGVSAFLMSKPEHREAGAAGLATSLIVGIPKILDDYMGTGLLGDEDLGAYMGEGMEMLGPAQGIEIQDSGSGSTGLVGEEQMGAITQEMGAITQEMGAAAPGIVIQGADFGATGFGG
jgi:hypothetical protein